MSVTITLDDEVSPALRVWANGLANMSPVMADIGQYMLNETLQNFAKGRGPDDSIWAPKSPVTVANYRRLGLNPGRPLFKEGALSDSVAMQSGADFAEVFVAALPYAAMMQFGGSKSQFPNLWGDIPARPFLGFAQRQQDDIRAILEEWLEGLIDG
jgi:phage virion morphogenesis protein